MPYANVPPSKLKTNVLNFKPQNLTKMNAQQFADRIDAITENFVEKRTSETHFKHAIQDLLFEVLYNNQDLKAHYYKQFEQEQKAWELQNFVSH